MLLNEQKLSARVIAALDERELPARIANRLMLARARALETAARASPAGRKALVLSRQRLVGSLGVFLFLLAAGVWYSNYMSASDLDYIDVDTAVISGDLPVQAYLDPGFDAYLRQMLSTGQRPGR